MRSQALFTLGLFLCLGGPLAADPQHCAADPLFRVTADDPALVDRTCRTAARLRGQLEQCGVHLDATIDIALLDKLDSQFGECLGLYHCGENRIEVLAPDAMSEIRDREGAFGLISDGAYWDSIIAHELTHAAFDKVTCPFSTCAATTEFASYSMQIWTLPKDQQALFGKTVQLKSKPGSGMISAMMLYMSPDVFAKNAWIHFLAQPDPCTMMGRVMDGQIFYDREPL